MDVCDFNFNVYDISLIEHKKLFFNIIDHLYCLSLRPGNKKIINLFDKDNKPI